MSDLNQNDSNPIDIRLEPEPTITSFLDLCYKLQAGDKQSVRADDVGALFQTIQSEILPRLMLVHNTSTTPRTDRQTVRAELDDTDHTDFLRELVEGSASSTQAFVDNLFKRGVSPETVFLDLLAGSARQLGEMWTQDLCSFSDVTIGLCRLHEVLRNHSIAFQSLGRAPANAQPRILLANASGDPHIFGLVMVAEFFRRDNWTVWCEPGADNDMLSDILSRQHFDLVGLSAGCDIAAGSIASQIEHLRDCSLNRGMKIIVGGNLFIESPELVARVGADGSAMDARQAPSLGKKLLAEAHAS